MFSATFLVPYVRGCICVCGQTNIACFEIHALKVELIHCITMEEDEVSPTTLFHLHERGQHLLAPGKVSWWTAFAYFLPWPLFLLLLSEVIENKQHAGVMQTTSWHNDAGMHVLRGSKWRPASFMTSNGKISMKAAMGDREAVFSGVMYSCSAALLKDFIRHSLC